MPPDPDDDPWDFLPKARPEPIGGGRKPRPDPLADLGEPAARPSGPLPELTFREAPPANEPEAQTPPPPPEPVPTPIVVPVTATSAAEVDALAAALAGAPPEPGAVVVPGHEAGADHPSAGLRTRARPLAIALAATSLAGLLTEVVGNSQLMTLVGPNSMLVLYPLSGLCLLLVAMLQFRGLDARARVRMLRGVNLGFAVLLAVAVLAVVTGVLRAAAIGVIWLSADQLNFLIPLLIWAAAGDEFNVAEGRRIYGWIIAWTYLGQVTGLAIGTFSPAIMDPLGVPLYWLLLADPLICGALGLWLPRALSGAATSAGQTRKETLREAMAGALDFVWQVPAWRAMLWASLLTMVAGMSLHLTYTMGLGIVVGDDAARLQVLFASMNLLALVICWIVSRSASERILERLGIPGTLIILPVATVLAGVLLAWGAYVASLALMIAGITVWRIPRLSVDESARRAALTLVPDQRRARVSFLVSLAPLGIGLVVSGLIAGIGVATGQFWVSSVVAGLLAVAALPAAVATRRKWDDSLLDWRMRRRKVMRHFE